MLKDFLCPEFMIILHKIKTLSSNGSPNVLKLQHVMNEITE